jgi:SAM-dependent methyltransferase/uncharacterized protein YbaR (Trm112 family)
MPALTALDPWWLEHLVCPRDHRRLTQAGDELDCGEHRYPVVQGVPIMLLDNVPHTLDIAGRSLDAASGDRTSALCLDTLSLSDDEKQGIVALAAAGGPIDPVVAYLVAATNGLMYKHLIGRLDRYPIPPLPLPPGNGRRLLDIGCSWGRWTVAASQAGYEAIGIDPSLGAVLAARRAAAQIGVSSRYLVGDARHLPFPSGTFDAAYSYSVIQHFSRADAGRSVTEIGRVLRPDGFAKVQMPTRFGLRCLYHQARRGFREGRGFEVRYWTGSELERLFTAAIGPTRLEADCFFGIGLQASDAEILTPTLRRVLRASEWMKVRTRRWPALVCVADSVFAQSVKAALAAPRIHERR